jgi:Domain of Unknown Function (DUF1080)/F5/8 type C domain
MCKFGMAFQNYLFGSLILVLSVFTYSCISQHAFSITNESCTLKTDVFVPSDHKTNSNPASSLFDGESANHWTPNKNTSEFIVDLKKQERVCFIDFGWGKNGRGSEVQISVSSNGTVQFKDLYSHVKISNDPAFERYDFQDISSRYLRFKFFSNSYGYTEITEIGIYIYKPTAKSSRLPEIPVLPVFDNFDNKTLSTTKWKIEYTGHGSTGIISEKGFGGFYRLTPASSTSPKETHAALVTSQENFSNFLLSLDVRTDSQLRQNSEPNNWEVAWVFFRYTDTFHYYWFSLKPNGFELGKKDCNSCKDPTEGQIILYTGPLPTLKIGQWSQWKIEARENHIMISVDDNKIIDYIDRNMSNPLSQGKIAMYTEDAKVSFDNLYLLNFNENK